MLPTGNGGEWRWCPVLFARFLGHQRPFHIQHSLVRYAAPLAQCGGRGVADPIGPPGAAHGGQCLLTTGPGSTLQRQPQFRLQDDGVNHPGHRAEPHTIETAYPPAATSVWANHVVRDAQRLFHCASQS